MPHAQVIAAPTLHGVGAALLLRIAVVFTGSLLASLPVTAAESPAEVLVWYVNETAPVDADLRNYETIVGWLESGDTDKARMFARTLREEQTLFRDAVDREQAVLEAGIVAAAGRLDALLVTNRLARAGKYRFYDRVAGRFVEAPLVLPPSDDYVLQSNPLVRRETLTAVLAEAARRYDPAAHTFVLITKSHGGPEHALAVRLPRHHEEISRDQLLASLAGATDGIPPPPKIGVTKADYFATLDEAGRRDGMRFSLVFMESCRGIFMPDEEHKLPTNVTLLYTSGNRSLQYSTLDYETLLKQATTERTLATALDEYLLPRYMALYREAPSIWQRFLWFTPLIIVFVLWSVSMLRRRCRRQS